MAEIALSAAAGLLRLAVILLAVLLVLGVIVLCIRLRLILHSERGVLKLWLGIGPFRISLDKMKGILKRAQDGDAQKKPAKKKAARDKPKRRPETQEQTAEIVELALSMLEDLRGLVDFPVFSLDAVIAVDDPACTGILVGQTAVLVSNLYPYLVTWFEIRDPHIWIDGDFERGHQTRWVFNLTAKTRLMRLVRFVMHRRNELSRLSHWIETLS